MKSQTQFLYVQTLQAVPSEFWTILRIWAFFKVRIKTHGLHTKCNNPQALKTSGKGNLYV